MRPHLLEDYLRAYDAALAARGARRSSGANCKTTVMLVGHPNALAAHEDPWDTPYVHASGVLLPQNSAAEVLGTVLGNEADTYEQFRDDCGKNNGLLDKIVGKGQPRHRA